MESVTLRVPASTSNLGSGFDTLGLAVNLFNEVKIVRGEPAARLPEMAREAAHLFFRRAGKSKFAFHLSIGGDIPLARGLGASAAFRAGVVAALNELCERPLSNQQLLELLTDLEGHPDNASPALLGGCTVSGRVGKEVRCLRFNVSPELHIVTLIPDFKVETEVARRLVPGSFSKGDTAHSLNRAALIAAAFASKNYEALRGLFDDRLHQPYREPLVPQLSAVIRAGERAGAIGGFLSGSGSAIICLSLKDPEAVARAMHRKLPSAEVKILRAENRGLRIIRRGGRDFSKGLLV
jgi:homoserine kinase